MIFVLHCLDNDLYVKSYDPDFIPPLPHPPYPNGLVMWTDDPDQAMQFSSALAALECWTTQSVTVPRRPDGMANRPLCHHTMQVEPLTVSHPERKMNR